MNELQCKLWTLMVTIHHNRCISCNRCTTLACEAVPVGAGLWEHCTFCNGTKTATKKSSLLRRKELCDLRQFT